jgi:predicted O-linked N-acetylglucosamine transferase (SPINDLY family)
MNNDDEIIFKNAISNFKEKKYLSASENFEYLLAKYPKNINLLKNLSLSYFHDRKFFKAETSLKNILKINNKDKDIVEFLIACLKKQDKAQEVIEVIKIYSDIINPKYNLMSKYERAQIPESVEDIEFIRKNTLEKISISCSDEKNNLKIDENFLDPPIFTFSYDNENNLDLTKKFHKLFINYYPELSQKICLKKKIRLDKIKIGFVSEYFSSHTISKLFKGINLHVK